MVQVHRKLLLYPFQVKHGEAAYPRDAWVEGQYTLKLENGAESANNLPQIHTISNNSNAEMPYNDPHFMNAQAGKENKGFDFELNIACNKKTDNKQIYVCGEQ